MIETRREVKRKMITKILLGAFVTVGILGASLLGYQRWVISGLEADVSTLVVNNSTLTEALNSQKAAIESLQDELAFSQRNREKLSTKLQVISKNFKETQYTLNTYKKRLKNAALKKPKLIESRANIAYSKLLRKFTEATRSGSVSNSHPSH